VKISLKNIKQFFDVDKIDTLKKFINFLQQNVPLSNEVVIIFTSDRPNDMTTGMRKEPSEIYVLSRERMLVDVMRTLAHEWVHEYQFQKMDLGSKKNVQDVGGEEENMANTLSGILVKRFDKEFPDDKKNIYHEE
jgi:hypothetical protein